MKKLGFAITIPLHTEITKFVKRARTLMVACLMRALAVHSADPDMQRRGRQLNILLLSSTVAILLLTGITLLELESHLSTLVQRDLLSEVPFDVLALLLVLSLIGLNRAGYTRQAAVGFFIVSIGGSTLFFEIQDLDRILLIYAMPIVASSFILSPGSSFIFAFLSALGYTLVYLSAPISQSYNSVSIFALALMAAVAWLAATSVENALGEARQSLTREQAVQDRLRSEIVERQQAEAALRVSEQRFRAVVTAAPIFLFATDAAGVITFLTGRGLDVEITDDLNHFVGRSVFDEHFPVPEALRTDIRRALAGETLTNTIETVGQVLELWYSPHRDEHGWLTGVIGVALNITERKALEEMWRRYAFIANTSQEFMTLIDRQRTYTAVNEAYCRAHDKTREEILGRTVAEVWGEARYVAHVKDSLDRCFAGHEVHTQAWFEFAVLGTRYLDVGYYPYSENGIVTHVVVVSHDTTEHKQAEKALRMAHAQNQQLLASISSILIGVSADDRITHWNVPAEAAFGLTKATMIGQTIADRRIPWDSIKLTQCALTVRSENRPVCLNSVRYSRPDGKDGYLNVTLSPFVGDEPGQPGFLLLAEDITERKVLEMQLAQAQKLEAIGRLAAGIAHEINTPIQFVGDNMRFLQESFCEIATLLDKYHGWLEAAKADDVSAGQLTEVKKIETAIDLDYLSREVPKALHESLGGIARVAEIVWAMREFSHPGAREKTAIDINKAIANTIAVTRNEWKYVANVHTDLDESLPPVPCLPGRFSQVILNLLINAAQAIADVVGDGSNSKGIITVTTRRADNWAEIYICDTGPGIPETARDRVFDPFFTTKEVGKGTGQGLAIAYDVIVKKHDGTITFETEADRGTTFIIRLPITESSITGDGGPSNDLA